MALKPYRNYGCGAGHSTINYMMNEVAEKGVMVIRCPNSSGSGLPGDPDNLACLPASSGGSPLGVLLYDVEDVDETKYCHRNAVHKNATTLCRPVDIVRKGELYTNMIDTGIDPDPGDDLYYTTGGLFTTSGADSEVVGTFEGRVQSDGYVLVRVDV